MRGKVDYEQTLVGSRLTCERPDILYRDVHRSAIYWLQTCVSEPPLNPTTSCLCTRFTIFRAGCVYRSFPGPERTPDNWYIGRIRFGPNRNFFGVRPDPRQPKNAIFGPRPDPKIDPRRHGWPQAGSKSTHGEGWPAPCQMFCCDVGGLMQLDDLFDNFSSLIP